MFPVSGAAAPNICGAERVAAEDLVEQAELELAEAGPAELLVEEDRPQALVLDLLLQALARSALIFGSGERTAYGKTYSSGSTSSRQNCSTQSSFSWNSGSVEKSHAMAQMSTRSVRAAGGRARTVARWHGLRR